MLPMTKSKYLARACGAASFAPSSNGNMQCAVPFEISQGEYTGETITWIGVMHDTQDKNGQSGAERVIASLQHAGWTGDDISELADIDDDNAKRMMPDEVQLTCEPETYDGKERLKVQWVNKPGGKFAFKEPMQGNQLKSFAAQLKSTVKAVRTASGSRPSTPGKVTRTTHPNAPGGSNDDIPFGKVRW